MKTIFFYDTNKIYGLLRMRKRGNSSWRSHALVQVAVYRKCYVSAFVIDELREKLSEKEGLSISIDDVQLFLSDTGFHFHLSEKSKDLYRKYTRDQDDAHILADAVSVKADYLITNNIKDFVVDSIGLDFGLVVLTMIPDEFLSKKYTF